MMRQLLLAHQIGISVVLPVPAHGKDKKEQPHDCTSICDAIVMLKWPQHVWFQRFRIFWKSFHAFPIKMRCLVLTKKKNPLFMWGWDRKIHLSQSPFVITRQASWCQSVILMTVFFIPPLHSQQILIILLSCHLENKSDRTFRKASKYTWCIF